MHYFFHFLIIVLLLLLSACHSSNEENKIKIENSSNHNSSTLSIDTFTEIPQDLSGCSCLYANDTSEFKQLKYIYVSDFNELSYVKINGKLLQFKQTNLNRKEDGTLEITARSGAYELFITTKNISNELEQEKEYSRETGTIRITDDKGRSVTKTFYGECGC